jgi:hypothetical protein
MQINPKMRSQEGAHFIHYCPACEQLHLVPTTWYFDRNFENPTVQPSIRHTAQPSTYCCHYTITGGMIQFHGDNSKAEWNGKCIPLPDLPEYLRD